MDLVAALEHQAGSCASLGSPMYADLLARLAADVAADGPTRAVLAGHEDDPGPSALALRLLGSVHRLVLDGSAPRLAAFYPSVGGSWDPEAGPAAVVAELARQPERVREWLDRAPQTNEVGRAAALYGALLQLPEQVRLPVRLVEIGASGGLNLLADRFCYVDPSGATYGPADSPVRLEPAWSAGAGLLPWPGLEVVERLGCDVAPIDPTTDQGRLALTAYVWPDQGARLTRLRGALDLAREVDPPPVVPVPAAALLDSVDLAEGTLTVVWHSIMWQYLPAAEQARATARLEQLGARADEQAPLAHIALEPRRRSAGAAHEFLVTARLWPEGREQLLGTGAAHGIPVTWEKAAS